jgi:hypothetical protein
MAVRYKLDIYLEQFNSSSVQLFLVGGIDHKDNSIHSTTVALPHGTESWLTTDVPQLKQN